METNYPGVPENVLQITFIKKMAAKMGVSPDTLSPHWIDLYSPAFREMWETGERDPETIEEKLYRPDPLGTGYADMIATILIGTPSPRIP